MPGQGHNSWPKLGLVASVTTESLKGATVQTQLLSRPHEWNENIPPGLPQEAVLSGKLTSALNKNNGIYNTILLLISFPVVQKLFYSSYILLFQSSPHYEVDTS